jgi:hypothetical protein
MIKLVTKFAVKKFGTKHLGFRQRERVLATTKKKVVPSFGLAEVFISSNPHNRCTWTPAI